MTAEIELTEEDVEMLRPFAEADRISVEEAARRAIRAYIDRRHDDGGDSLDR